jgi:hypothetical protein
MCRPLLHTVRLAVLMACLLPSSLALAAGDANHPNLGECSAATEASPGFRTYLPDCRAYEMVTPPYKEGGVISDAGIAISSDGSRVVGLTTSAFAGIEDDFELDAYYEFQRDAAGWVTSPLSPPASLFPQAHPPQTSLPVSADLGASLWSATTTSTLGAEEDLYLEPSPGTSLRSIGPEQPPPSTGGGSQENLSLVGASTDLTHTLFRIISPSEREIELGQNRPWPGDTTIPSPGRFSLYEYVGTANTEPALVGVSNQEQLRGKPHLNEGAALISQCGTTLGGVQEAVHDDVYNAVSGSGGTVFFTAHSGPCEESGVAGAGPKVNELYARIDGTTTVAISEPSLSVPGRQCTGECREAQNEEGGFERHEGDFAGASADGSKVFFTTEQPLANEDKGTNTDLYMEEINGSSVNHLVQVSHDPHAGQTAEVQGVARVSEDGSHVYFVAKGELTEGPNHEGKEPVAGADNLYVYDTANDVTKFVATLLMSEAEATKIEEEGLSELLEEVGRCNGSGSCRNEAIDNYLMAIGSIMGVWSPSDLRPVQATPDGRFLVFSSLEQLTGGDESKVPQLFEYNAETEKLVRVSIGHDGYNDDGNVAEIADVPRIPEPNYDGEKSTEGVGAGLPATVGSSLAISTDGSRIVFESEDSLVPQAIAGTNNVYEYREGNVYLISDGQHSPSGHSAHLIGMDGSGGDVFFSTEDQLVPQDTDTLLNIFDAREEGGFPAPPSAAGCSGDTCQGALAVPPPLPLLSGSATQVGGENVASPESKPSVRSKAMSLTRAQKLAKALKVCKVKPKKRRTACEKLARKKYVPAEKKDKR